MPSASASGSAAESEDDGPLSAAEFAGLMRPFEPFEPAPAVACAVSGGADSLALLLLLDAWARARGGMVVALTVDHGLRAESAAEAAWVGALCAARGIAHHCLTWCDDRPQRGVQAAARAARYRLLEAACRERAILHLALAHHREDQAETFLLRVQAGSGADGLAGMPAVSEQRDLRRLRPLLGVPKARLVATLRAAGLDWREDPSNRDWRYARVRLRAALPALEGLGLGPARLAAAAAVFGRLRAWREARLGEVLAAAVTVHPAGFLSLDAPALLALPSPLAEAALARVLRHVGGRAHPSRTARLARLVARLRAGGVHAATLGGCRLLARPGGWLVVREPAAAAGIRLAPGEALRWDGRFRVRLAAAARPAGGTLRVEALGEAGWADLVARAPWLRAGAVPAAARAGLPAFRDLDGLWAVPHFNYTRAAGAESLLTCDFCPRQALADAGFTAPRGGGQSGRGRVRQTAGPSRSPRRRRRPKEDET